MTHDTELLRRQLHQRDPAPFVELLIQVLQNAPSPEDLARFAKSSPDKFVKMTKQLASVVGYSEKIAVSHQHSVSFDDMTDMELRAYIREQRKALPLEVIEAEAIEVKEGPAAVGPSEQDLRDAGIVPKKDLSKQ